MRNDILMLLILIIFYYCFLFDGVNSSQQNHTSHHQRKSSIEERFFKVKKQPSYRSYQPAATKYRKYNSVRSDDRNDYDGNTYDTEYGGVVTNFTSSIYDDNPPLYPNPDFIARSDDAQNQIYETIIKPAEPEIELPDDSLADADLKEHNIIDSVTYLYGFNGCHGNKNEWTVLIFIASAIAVVLLVLAVIWLMWSEYAAEFRSSSHLYPINLNLCCSFIVCILIYIQATVGADSPSQCERIALLLHYTHIVCASWIATLGACVSEYCSCGTLLPLNCHYLLAYGAPASLVMFNYAMSIEQYEIKHYCWMSIEKGMVMGFMVPAMLLIVVNTCICILGLQSVNKKQAEMLTMKIQELVDHHIANWPKYEPAIEERNRSGSVDTLENIYSPSGSRKNTDSSDTLDREYNFSEDECQYVNVNLGNGDINDVNNEMSHARMIHDRNVLNMLYMDNISGKWSWNTEGNELKTYLNLCLILEPFFSINWVMGVVAIENANHWSTPTIYLFLVVAMYLYFTVTICTTLPNVRRNNPNPEPCCDEIVSEPTLTRTRTTDSIPLLDPAIQQPNQTPAPHDTISTISI